MKTCCSIQMTVKSSSITTQSQHWISHFNERFLCVNRPIFRCVWIDVCKEGTVNNKSKTVAFKIHYHKTEAFFSFLHLYLLNHSALVGALCRMISRRLLDRMEDEEYHAFFSPMKGQRHGYHCFHLGRSISDNPRRGINKYYSRLK